MDILQDDKYWKHELNIQSRGSKSQNIIKFQELVMYIYNNLNTNNYIIDDPLDFSVEDNSYSSSEMMNGSLKIYNANVPSLLDSDEESDSHEEDFIIKPFLLLEEGIKAHNEEKYDNAWECLVAQSEIENLKAKYWKTYCYLYNGINIDTQFHLAELYIHGKFGIEKNPGEGNHFKARDLVMELEINVFD
ncbi:hypothetical protein GLOIN_2v1778170 [Rhizophagus irregularis DAOM 181602=DAOM 197198]|uniref:Uncharacterized protein n=1 Tax=Rhizophagus irregularis (strain DAOM 181602 / DAOM 197198 / MUCL 43194) TaxID=747089 RepID=A0A2P4PT09_RHIID|nr:hypothetical protein GLOIN_2v1778170 [Rhizophagus irregularis DAOM 181602=DAOM 197198]POG68517.1 hypothetical protein GLOIN_2v1778170 [Rhizophagus irregularis DAOM 181602=DAOM 197198]|eukprot:XP_025175383.1 hypothetical protein GLOIN_2v1778170 [Rhizophagus irregularis DAOM 181602=DAOM 197198]